MPDEISFSSALKACVLNIVRVSSGILEFGHHYPIVLINQSTQSQHLNFLHSIYYVLLHVHNILCFYYSSFGCNFSCILVEWLWRGGLFCSIFLFYTCITWWWANAWMKHVAGSYKLNVQNFRCCGWVDWMFRNLRMRASA